MRQSTTHFGGAGSLKNIIQLENFRQNHDSLYYHTVLWNDLQLEICLT